MSSELENKLKSWFLSGLVVYSWAVTLGGGFMLISELGSFSIWLAVTMASAQIALYFLWLEVAQVPRTSPGLMGFSVGIFAATLYSVYASYAQQIASAAPLLAFISLSGWLAYVGWSSELGDRSKDRIKVGKRLPKIELEDYDGRRLSSDDWVGDKRLVIFYRGNWCPICTAQVNELRNFEKQFNELGLKITLISPQSHEKSRRHAQKVGADYDFLVDVDNAAARTLGILHTDGLPKGYEVLGYESNVPKPTTFVLDEKGKVVFADLTKNYRLRPRPEDIIRALQA
ncbi:MAG: redoxin domain-containing protein [Flavobacteriales bacterium]|nr:redoxin domain-containing protein [Flavobacteriales bacterium]